MNQLCKDLKPEIIQAENSLIRDLPIGSLPEIASSHEYSALSWYCNDPDDELFKVLVEVDKVVTSAIQEMHENHV